MGKAVIPQGSAGNGGARICLKDGRRLLVTKGVHGLKVSQIRPLPAPEDCVWRQDYAAGTVLDMAYRRIVMLLTAGRSIAQIAARENLPETLRANRVAGIAAALCHGILGAAFAAVEALQKDPLHAESLGSDPKIFTKDGVEAAFECMAFLTHATGRFALATLGPGGRDDLMDALSEVMVARFTRVVYGRRMDASEHEAMVERLAGRLAARNAEYEGCTRPARPGGGPGGAMLWEVGTRTAELLGRTNEIAFIDATDDQMTACLDGLHLAARLLPLREPDAGASPAPATPRRATPGTRSQPEGPRPQRPGASLRERRPEKRSPTRPGTRSPLGKQSDADRSLVGAAKSAPTMACARASRRV